MTGLTPLARFQAAVAQAAAEEGVVSYIVYATDLPNDATSVFEGELSSPLDYVWMNDWLNYRIEAVLQEAADE